MPQSLNLKISNLPDDLPDYAKPVKANDSGLPDYAKPVENAKEKVKEPTMLERAFEFANKPRINILSPEQRKSNEEAGLPNLEDTPATAQLKGFSSGAKEGIADFVSSLSTPLNIGLTLASGGANAAEKFGADGLATILHGPGKLASIGMMLHGGKQVIDQPTVSGKIGGLTEATMGGLGLKGLNDVNPLVKKELPKVDLPAPDIADVPRDHVPVGEEPIVAKETKKSPQDIAYENARNRFNMGHNNPNTKPPLDPEAQSARDQTKGHYQKFEGQARIDQSALDHFISNQPEFKDAKISDIPELYKLYPEDFPKDYNPPHLEMMHGGMGAIDPKVISDWLKRPNKQVPINNATKNLRIPEQEVIDKLVNALTSAAPKRMEQENLYSIERAKRIAKAEQAKGSGLPGFYNQLHELKGELPKVDFERTKLSQGDVNSLINYITNSQKLLPYEKIRAKMGLLKLLSAKREELPQRNELQLLNQIFGSSFDKIVEMHGGFGGHVPVMKLANTSKALMASIDVSAPLRQGLPLIHKSQWWSAIGPMLKSFGNESYYNDLMKSIEERPNYLLGKKAGLSLTGIGKNPEEAYGSSYAELVPGVKASERAYTGFLNKLRADTFDSLVENAKDLGLKVDDEAGGIARFVNNATGRGDLGRLNKVADELNTVFFSPRLIAARLTTLNPKYYVDASPFVRKEALKSLLAIAGAGITIDSLAKAMGAEVSSNPTSSDFGKAKFGNTRIDPFGGFQQYIVAAARMIKGETTSSITGKTSQFGKGYKPQTRRNVLLNFGENKLSPIASLADVILKGKDFNGNPTNISKEVADRFTPLLINDLIDVYKDDPNHLPLGIGAALGMGMQTYSNNRQRIRVR